MHAQSLSTSLLAKFVWFFASLALVSVFTLFAQQAAAQTTSSGGFDSDILNATGSQTPKLQVFKDGQTFSIGSLNTSSMNVADARSYCQTLLNRNGGTFRCLLDGTEVFNSATVQTNTTTTNTTPAATSQTTTTNANEAAARVAELQRELTRLQALFVQLQTMMTALSQSGGSSVSVPSVATPGVCTATSIRVGCPVVISDTLNVRQTPSTVGTALGTQRAGSQGRVIAGPTTAAGLTWWQVDFSAGADGWVAEGNATERWVSAIPAAVNPTIAIPSVGTSTTATGTGQVYRDGELVSTFRNRTRGAITDYCQNLATNLPTGGFRCLFEGVEVFTKGAAIIAVDGEIQEQLAGYSRFRTISDCQSTVSANPGKEVTCSWENEVLQTTLPARPSYEQFLASLDTPPSTPSTPANTTPVYDGPTGSLIARLNGTVFNRNSNITAEESFDICAAKARQNPTGEVSCIWNNIQVFPAGLGRLVVTQDGVQVGQSSNRTQQDALARCRERAANNPDSRVRCTFDGRELYRNYGQVEIFVNGRKDGNTVSRIRDNALNLCVRRANDGDKKTPKETIRCTYDGTELYPGALTNQYRVYSNLSENSTGMRNNMTRQQSVARCKELSDNAPKQGFRCTWQGIDVAVHGTLVLDFIGHLDSDGKIEDPNSNFARRLKQAETANKVEFVNLVRDGANSSKYLQVAAGISEAQAKNICGFMSYQIPYSRVCWWNREPVDETNFQKGTQWLPRDFDPN